MTISEFLAGNPRLSAGRDIARPAMIVMTASFRARSSGGAMNRRGFTLLELLTVTAIVAVLAAITFSATMKARETARRATCFCNLRQIGHAVSMYSQDYDDVLPVPAVSMPRRSWVDSLQPYVSNNWLVFRCPNMADSLFGSKNVWGPDLPPGGNRSIWEAYGWNVDYLAPGTPFGSSLGSRPKVLPAPVSLAVVAKHADTVLCAGIGLEPGSGSWAGTSSLYPVRGGYYAAPSPAGVGLNLSSGEGGWGQGCILGPYGGFEAPRHDGRGNVLFLDGHVRAMTAEQLAAGTNWTPAAVNSRIQVTDPDRYVWDLQ